MLTRNKNRILVALIISTVILIKGFYHLVDMQLENNYSGNEFVKVFIIVVIVLSVTEVLLREFILAMRKIPILKEETEGIRFYPVTSRYSYFLKQEQIKEMESKRFFLKVELEEACIRTEEKSQFTGMVFAYWLNSENRKRKRIRIPYIFTSHREEFQEKGLEKEEKFLNSRNEICEGTGSYKFYLDSRAAVRNIIITSLLTGALFLGSVLSCLDDDILNQITGTLFLVILIPLMYAAWNRYVRDYLMNKKGIPTMELLEQGIIVNFSGEPYSYFTNYNNIQLFNYSEKSKKIEIELYKPAKRLERKYQKWMLPSDMLFFKLEPEKTWFTLTMVPIEQGNELMRVYNQYRKEKIRMELE